MILKNSKLKDNDLVDAAVAVNSAGLFDHLQKADVATVVVEFDGLGGDGDITLSEREAPRAR